MQFQLGDRGTSGIRNFVAILTKLVRPPVTVQSSDQAHAETGDVSLFDIFEVSRAYRQRFGERVESAYPVATSRQRVGQHQELELFTISQVIGGCVTLHLSTSGRRGQTTFGIYRHAGSSPARHKKVKTYAKVYGENAVGQEIHIEVGKTFAAELFALWYAKDDERLIQRVVELYDLVAPKPLPAYVILSRPQELPDRSVDAAANRRLTIPDGLYNLILGDRPHNTLYKLFLQKAGGLRHTNAAMYLTEWEAAAAASNGAIKLVYHRERFAWLPQVDSATETASRQAHDGQQFQVLSPHFDDGYIRAYQISFQDGFETWACPEEIEEAL